MRTAVRSPCSLDPLKLHVSGVRPSVIRLPKNMAIEPPNPAPTASDGANMPRGIRERSAGSAPPAYRERRVGEARDLQRQLLPVHSQHEASPPEMTTIRA